MIARVDDCSGEAAKGFGALDHKDMSRRLTLSTISQWCAATRSLVTVHMLCVVVHMHGPTVPVPLLLPCPTLVTTSAIL